MSHTKSLPKKSSKRTYQLSTKTLEKFEAEVPPGKRGAAVDAAIDKWLEEKERQQLRAEILRGLADEDNEKMSLEEAEIWAKLSDEQVEFGDEEWPEPAIVWPEGLRAERLKHGDSLDEN